MNGDTPTSAVAGVVERGAFAHARCPCGWQGPGRRARDGARRDAADHNTLHHSAEAGAIERGEQAV